MKKLLVAFGINPFEEIYSIRNIAKKILIYGLSRLSIIKNISTKYARIHQFKEHDLVIIGAQKAATTWLHQVLEETNCFSLGAEKEAHFFDRGLGISFREYIKKFKDNREIQAEIGPDYSSLNIFDIMLFKLLFPKTKIVFIARNPIDRAISQATMEISRRGQKPKSQIESEEILEYTKSPRVVKRSSYDNIIDKWSLFYNDITIIFYDDLLTAHSRDEAIAKLPLAEDKKERIIRLIKETPSYEQRVFPSNKLDISVPEDLRKFFISRTRKITANQERTDIFEKWNKS